MKSQTISRLFLLSILFVSIFTTINAQHLCPAIYSDNATGRIFEGEMFAGASLYQLERNEWLPLPNLKADMGAYRTVIANEDPQIQHFNLFELAVVDHPAKTEVLIDKYGNLHTLQLVQMPRMAVDKTGRDVQRFLVEKDSLVYFGNFDDKSATAEESLVLEFRRPHGILEGKVVIDAKTSTWLDEAYGRYLDQLGSSVEEPLSKSSDKIQKWMLDQNIPLKVWLETAPGVWHLQGWFNLAGSKTMRRDVLMIDLSAVPAETVRIKLTTGFLFWEIDRVGMDFSTNLPVLHQALKPLRVVDQKGNDFTQALLADDSMYLTLDQTGDAVTAVFVAPKQHDGLVRTVFLHGKGYYDLLRETPQFQPDPEVLSRFYEPNGFAVFSREQWSRLKK